MNDPKIKGKYIVINFVDGTVLKSASRRDFIVLFDTEEQANTVAQSMYLDNEYLIAKL